MTYDSDSDLEKKQRENEEKLLIEVDDGLSKSSARGKSDGNVTFILMFSIFVAVSGSFTCGLAFGYSSPVQIAIIKDVHLSIAQYSLFVSMLTVGAMLGALACGKLTDFVGRRRTMGIGSILCLAGWLSIVYAQDARCIDIGRLALGFATGILTYVIPVYIAEIAPKNLRGGLGLLHQFMMCCGIAVVFLAGIITSWRVLALIGSIPCMIQLLGLCFIPESPRWLGFTEADENISVNFFSVFQRKYAYALTVTLGLMAFYGFGGTNGILFYASTIFESAGVSATVGTVTMALIQLPPVFLSAFLLDKCGRRPLLLFSVAGMVIACFLVAISFLLKTHGWMMDVNPYFALAGILIFSAACPLGMGGIPTIIMSEIFPMNIKGAAGTLAIVVINTSSWIVTYTFIFMMHWSPSGTFFVFTIVNVISLVFVLKLVPETKGLTLEEIQELVLHRASQIC